MSKTHQRLWALFVAATLGACAGENKSGDDNKTVQDTAKATLVAPDSSGAEAAADSTLPKTTIKFDKTKHDFGNIVEGDSAVYDFTFTNTGTNPLKISKVKPACGCTTPSYTKEAVAPGEKGFVRVKFDSNGRAGKANKDVTVFANTEPAATKLTFTAEVAPKDKK